MTKTCTSKDLQEIVIIKLGGSSITDKSKFETLNKHSLEWFGKILATNIHPFFLSSCKSKSKSKSNTCMVEDTSDNPLPTNENNHKPAFVIIHGAGSFGHHHAKQFGLKGESKPPQENENFNDTLTEVERKRFMTGLATTRASVKKLNNEVVSILLSHNINAVGISPCVNIPIQAHGGNECNGLSLLIESIQEALSVGLVPVIHGDAGLYGYQRDNMRSGILGGDQLVEMIATSQHWNKYDVLDGRSSIGIGKHESEGDNINERERKRPRLVTTGLKQSLKQTIFLTDVEGVYTKDPNLYPLDAKLLRNIFIDPNSGDIAKVSVAEEGGDGTGHVGLDTLQVSGSSHEHDVTGGLKTKLGSAAVVAKSGTEVKIVKCCSKSAEQAISGEVQTDLGTVITKEQ
mmetsp:Transcript_16781/g.19407  ORF Transcript_16781/g.19407 Transcript_16781/m.19407 type:complete len:402 (-) Transcript_16781:12-1217(-)